MLESFLISSVGAPSRISGETKRQMAIEFENIYQVYTTSELHSKQNSNLHGSSQDAEHALMAGE